MIYVSVSTIPQRIKTIHKSIESLLNQTLKPDKIFINIPNEFRRFKEKINDNDIPKFPSGVEVTRCEDSGPGTKLLGSLKKIDNDYPNEIILVLDATTGQNALNQVEVFSKIHNLTGLIITKLDSTAKGGIVLAICKKYKLPIIAVGMGEKEDDLQPFKADLFAKTLLSIN